MCRVKPQVLLNCPECGRTMTPLLSQGRWHFYACEKCGPMTLPSRGPIRRTDAMDYRVTTAHVS